MDENETLAEPLGTASGGVGTDTPPPPPPPPPYAPPSYPPPPLARPQLRRSRSDRVLGGVCGGFGRYFDLDPVLLRILVVVATLFTGGALAIAYIVAWLVIPDDPAWAPVAPVAPTSYAAGGTGTFVDPATGQVYGAVPPAPPVRREPRSYLGLLALSVSVVVGGLLTILAVSGVDIPVTAVASAMLAVLGIALLVGAFRGRAKWLILPALVLLLVAQAASVLPRAVSSSFGAGAGDRRWVPTTLATQSYELGAGEAVLDLRSLPAGKATLSARVSLGTLRIVVPADTSVVLLGRVGAGETQGVANPQQGTNITVDETIPAVSATPSTTVDLTAELGLGTLEVDRATS